MYTCNPIIGEAKAGNLLVQSQPGPHWDPVSKQKHWIRKQLDFLLKFYCNNVLGKKNYSYNPVSQIVILSKIFNPLTMSCCVTIHFYVKHTGKGQNEEHIPKTNHLLHDSHLLINLHNSQTRKCIPYFIVRIESQISFPKSKSQSPA